MSPKTRQIQFLICDDNKYLRRLVAEQLAVAGFERVQSADTGVELLRLRTRKTISESYLLRAA